MRICHRTLLFAASLFFIELAVTPASAFYNPNSGRWLSRDPIGQRGGVNLYAAFRGDPVRYVDPRGLELHYRLLKDTVNNISALAGGGHIFGLTSWSAPFANDVTEDEIIRDCFNCASLLKVREYDVSLTVRLPSNAVGVYYTEGGYNEIVKHEKKREDAVRRAYNAYIERINTELPSLCPRVCKPSSAPNYSSSRSALEEWLATVRANAIQAFNAYTDASKTEINRENPLLDVNDALLEFNADVSFPPFSNQWAQKISKTFWACYGWLFHGSLRC